MKYYLAPLEGITGYIYRNAYHQHFHPMDKYFTPFLMPNQNQSFTSRELNDIIPEHNQGLMVVPQILTNSAADFIFTAQKLKSFGYQEVNLNLGCPSKTVVTKNKGAGFLAKPEVLNAFFETIFSQIDIRISVKTRIGKDTTLEFPALMAIFNQYPLEELIIHPRIQTDFYKNKPNLEVFEAALKDSHNRVCYNGDIFSAQDYKLFHEHFPDVDCVMIGRGILANPGLINKIVMDTEIGKQQLRAFHDQIYRDYQAVLFGDRNVLFKMKELWFYLSHIFREPKKYIKKIKKAEKLRDYEIAVEALFRDRELIYGRFSN